MKKRVIIITAAVILAAAAITIAIVLFINNREAEVPAGETEDSYYLIASPTNLLVYTANHSAFSNDFLYYEAVDGIWEYGLLNKTSAKINFQNNNDAQFDNYTMLDGNIYAVQTVFNEIRKDIDYSIVRIDYNSGKISTIYTPDDLEKNIGFLTASVDGKIYFIEGSYEEDMVDENGYTDSFSLFEFDPASGKKSELLKAVSYYIHNDIIYFAKLNVATNATRLFYCDLSDPSNSTDTGVNVELNASKNSFLNGSDEILMMNPCFYYPYDNKVYYSSRTNQLMFYDMNSGETSVVYTFGEEVIIHSFLFFDDKILLLVNEPIPKPSRYSSQLCLYSLDADGNIEKLIDDIELNKDYEYMYEWIDYIAVYNGCNDYFILSTYNQELGTIAYLVDKDYNIVKIIENGDWDYEAYAKMMKEIEAELENYPEIAEELGF